MRVFTQNQPLTDAELDRLGDFLEGCKGGRAMNVEQVDGFFAALKAADAFTRSRWACVTGVSPCIQRNTIYLLRSATSEMMCGSATTSALVVSRTSVALRTFSCITDPKHPSDTRLE
jgi:uncharacterized protein